MSKDDSYLRWLGRSLANLPRALKGVVVTIGKCKSLIEFLIGMYGVLFGIIGAITEMHYSDGTLYQFLGVTRVQWGLVVFVGFFLATHGLYGMEKDG